jgi:hypothetical protein
MVFIKTDEGRKRLLTGGISQDTEERRVLMLCDGKRPAEVIERMLGVGAKEKLRNLEKAGLICTVGLPVNSANDQTVVVETNLQAAHQQHQVSEPVRAIGAAQVVADTKPRGMRSWAASKMYLVSILQMQRDVDSASLAVNLHSSSEPENIYTGILQSLAHMSQLTSATVYRRVFEKLLETVPETHLPHLTGLFNQVFPMRLADSA